ncbi:hypothetical protein [Thiocapsa marina]|uniref:DUF4340 domain-containing protein n=1 Tax=Thiocapsa marina 5811 TaxID=768671 RepID=F9UE84_9GAMM|nr:hypothetical protein [Thiocapsa marina]EGV17641.1 hypothetical protein ThimaDRAFT_3186 [Thiocapsa marina 5811]
MRSRWILNLILILVLSALVWGIRHELAVTRTPPTLAGSGTPEPHLIEIVREGEPTIALERLVSGWRMRSPWDVDADPDRVAALLAIRDAPLLRSVPAQAAALDELGLDPVKLRLRLDATEIAMGGLDPIAQWRYVASDDLVHLIPDRFQHMLIAPPLDAVARAPIPRDLVPVFATRNSVPLSGGTLTRLAGLVAERVEPLIGEPTGALLEVSASDGARVRYRVSEDGRRWTRPDLMLTYVLGDAPELIEDPRAIDPTPPGAVAPPFAGLDVGSDVAPDAAPSDAAWPESAAYPGSDVFAPDPAPPPPGDSEWRESPGTLDSLMDPDAPLSGELPLGSPPEVRLRPHDMIREEVLTRDGVGQGGFGVETGRELPEGFGLDPFAPDSADTGPVPEDPAPQRGQP